MAKHSVKENCRNIRPMMPCMKPMGRNTATMENVVANTASPISCVPSIDA